MTLPAPRAADWHPAELGAGVGHCSEHIIWAQHLLAFLSHTCCQFVRLENENGKNLRTTQPFLTNSTHLSEFCSESRSSQGVVTDTELEEADMLLCPAATTLRSGEDALLREEDDWWVGMVVQPQERGKRGEDVLTYHVSIPSSNHPPSLHGNGSGIQRVGGGGAK